MTMSSCSHVNPQCNGGTGSVSAGSISNSNGALSYVWKNSGNVVVGTTPTVSGLAVGTYTLTVTDNCSSVTCSQTITEPSVLTISVTTGTINCYGGTTCITVSGSGGTSPYSGTGTFCNYSAGTYVVEIYDTNNCIASQTITISEPSKVTASATSTPESCGTMNGTATVTASGGTAPYTYLWSPGSQTSQTATGLSAGTYTVTVTDSKGCTGTSSATVGTAGSAPGMPGTITGPAGACKGQNSVTYCIQPVANATSYMWTLPTGVTGSATGTCITL